MTTFMGFMLPHDGYGYAAINIAGAMRGLDPGVRIVDMRGQTETFGYPDERSWQIADRAVAMCVPPWLPSIRAGALSILTMCETTRLAQGWAETINRHASECIVPSRFCADVFMACGVHTKITVAPWGVNSNDFWTIDRRGHGTPYTFVWSGTPDYRKGWDVAYRAFYEAFGWREDVRLILHLRNEMPFPMKFRDPNVEVRIGILDRPAWRALLAEADCFVFPSRGEGWGMPPREAAATGLPVITTRWSGLAEDIDEWAIPIEVAGLSPARYGWFSDVGEWAEPDRKELAGAMLWCASNPVKAAEIGARAAAWLTRNGSWAGTAARILTRIARMDG